MNKSNMRMRHHYRECKGEKRKKEKKMRIKWNWLHVKHIHRWHRLNKEKLMSYVAPLLVIKCLIIINLKIIIINKIIKKFQILRIHNIIVSRMLVVKIIYILSIKIYKDLNRVIIIVVNLRLIHKHILITKIIMI